MTENETRIVKNYCNECKKETKHFVLKEHTVSYGDCYSIDYQIVECCGCCYVSFRKENLDFENYLCDNEGNYIPFAEVFHYPVPVKYHQGIEFDDIYELPKSVRTIYQNTLISYANDAKILASVGLRACIEAVCSNLGIQGKLHEQISILNQKGFITESNAIWLNGIRFLGNESVHEMKQPDNSEFSVALRIVEHLFENVYILPKISEGKLKLVKPNISNYEDFLDILSENLKSFIENANKQIGLYKLLGDDFGRCKDNISDFEQKLNDDIVSGRVKGLEIGEVHKTTDKEIQLYRVVYSE